MSLQTTDFCDGISRRALIQAGLAGTVGLSLPDLLRLKARSAEAGVEPRDTAVIYVCLTGGPAQHETYDPKPNAPQEYRGPFQAINTNIPGVQFSEMMVEQAKIMDKLAVIRSIHHDSSVHWTSEHLVNTGYYLRKPLVPQIDMPCMGSYTARIRGANAPGMPAFVMMPLQVGFAGAAWLGKEYNPFVTGRDAHEKDFQVPNLTLLKGLTTDRVKNRRALVAGFDAARKIIDNNGVAEAIDQFTHQAFDMVTGEAARSAFDLTQEDDKTRAQYGMTGMGQNMLLARRLVERGVTFVSVVCLDFGGWDDHLHMEKRMKKRCPAYDQAIAALVRDLHERGLNKKTMIVAMGEFGRSPRINKDAGRDHWPGVMSVLMAGGDIKTGQVIGSTDSNGAVVLENPYRPENVLSMLFRHLGIDP